MGVRARGAPAPPASLEVATHLTPTTRACVHDGPTHGTRSQAPPRLNQRNAAAVANNADTVHTATAVTRAPALLDPPLGADTTPSRVSFAAAAAASALCPANAALSAAPPALATPPPLPASSVPDGLPTTTSGGLSRPAASSASPAAPAMPSAAAVLSCAGASPSDPALLSLSLLYAASDGISDGAAEAAGVAPSPTRRRLCAGPDTAPGPAPVAPPAACSDSVDAGGASAWRWREHADADESMSVAECWAREPLRALRARGDWVAGDGAWRPTLARVG